jgi:alpha-beta hydrolase superfamily lysophospholipase
MLMEELRSQDERPPASAFDRLGFRTQAVEFKNDSGARLSAYVDTPAVFSSTPNIVIIAPAYGETKENNILISSYFAANGYRSVRLDWSDHVGESDGEIFACTLSKMLADLSSLVRQCAAQFPRARLGIVASSLAGRVTLKLASGSDRIDFLLLVAPVVSLQETLLTSYREDLVGRYTAGKRYGALDVLGFSIDADAFLEDAVRHSFADLESSLLDAEKVTACTMLCIGDKDPWV